MGAGLALSVGQGPHVGLDPVPKLALTRMCLAAGDQHPEPTYFDGWQPLAEWLGYRGSETTNRIKVRDVIRRLHAADAITGTARGGVGRRAAYRLWPRDRAERLPDGLHKEPCWLCRPSTG